MRHQYALILRCGCSLYPPRDDRLHQRADAWMHATYLAEHPAARCVVHGGQPVAIILDAAARAEVR